MKTRIGILHQGDYREPEEKTLILQLRYTNNTY